MSDTPQDFEKKPWTNVKGKLKMEIPLEFGITEAGVESKMVSMRRPKVKDQLAMDAHAGSAAKKEVFMFASLCVIGPQSIEDLHMSDYRRLQETYDAFMNPQE